MIGLASSPGTAVLPICSIPSPGSASAARMASASAAKRCGQTGSAGSTSMRSSSALLQRWPSKRGGWGGGMAGSGEIREIGDDGNLGWGE